MAKLNFTSKLQISKYTVDTSLNLLHFVEDNIHYIYSPELEIYGYGQSENQARDSFTTSFREMVDYMVKKNTLAAELESLGWSVRKTKNKFRYEPPLMSNLIEENEELKNIVNTKSYTKYNHAVQLPAFA
jgi:hypothetical protein